MTRGDVVTFDCTSNNCKQNWRFMALADGDIDINCVVLKHLWPSGMKENSKMYREQFLPAWLEKQEFRANALHIGGFINDGEKDERLQQAQDALDKWHEEHPEKPWWKFW